MPKRLADTIEEHLNTHQAQSRLRDAERLGAKPDALRKLAEEMERDLQREYVILPKELHGRAPSSSSSASST